MGLSRNKVAVSEGAAGSPPFYGEREDMEISSYKRLYREIRFNETLLFNFEGPREKDTVGQTPTKARYGLIAQQVRARA